MPIYSSQNQSKRLLFCRQNHLFSLALPFHCALLAMFPNILFLSLNRFEFLALNLAGLLNRLRNMPMALNPSDFGHMRISLY